MFGIYFVIWSIKRTNGSLIFTGHQEGEYTPNSYLIQKQLFADILRIDLLKNFAKLKGNTCAGVTF